MPKKAKGKSKARKSASRKPAGKTLKTKAIAKKKALKKKAAKKTAAKAKPARKQAVPEKSVMVEPGPPSGTMPPVEEPVRHEEAIGAVTHYYSHLNVAVIQLNKGALKTGDTIHIKGNTTDFTQQAESMEFERRQIEQATAGQSFGLKVIDLTREHDIVYLVK